MPITVSYCSSLVQAAHAVPSPIHTHSPFRSLPSCLLRFPSGSRTSLGSQTFPRIHQLGLTILATLPRAPGPVLSKGRNPPCKHRHHRQTLIGGIGWITLSYRGLSFLCNSQTTVWFSSWSGSAGLYSCNMPRALSGHVLEGCEPCHLAQLEIPRLPPFDSLFRLILPPSH